MESPAETGPVRRRRFFFATAAVIAAVITVVFSVVGDGVPTPSGSTVAVIVIDWGHQLVWGLLTVAFAVAAVYGRWTKASQVFSMTALTVYAIFLIAVFFTLT